MGNLLFRIKILLKVTFIYIVYFPGLVLHEASHALLALVTFSKITKISLFPSIAFSPDGSSYAVTYGYVSTSAKINASYILIGFAPFLLHLIPISIALHFGWYDLQTSTFRWGEFMQIQNIWFLLVLAQIAWAGFPSSQDWKMVFHGLFSISGATFLAIACTPIYRGFM